MPLLKRSDMDKKDTWDVSHIYKTKQDWLCELEATEKLIPTIEALAGTLGESKETFKKAFEIIDALSLRITLVGLYGFLVKSGDNGDSESQKMDAKSTRLYVMFGTALSFLEPEILSIDEKVLTEWLAADDMEVYRQNVDNIIRGKAHILDNEKEKMLAMLGEVEKTPADAFDMLSEVDMVFPTMLDENGEEIQITHGNFGVLRESSDPRVRKEAFEKYFGVYKNFINTTTATYAGSIKMNAFFAKTRGFASSRHAALFDSNVPVEVYDSLIEAVHSGIPTMEKYLSLRKKALKQDELNIYDLYCPMVDEIEYKTPFATAKELVKQACKPLGEKYAQLLDKAYNENWIDVYENKGKSTGAYSCGVYGVHPYVLLNYTDTLDDAFTLAHELGHAMHSYLSSEKQAFINHDYKITVAEVASTVNEVLLTMHLLKVETDKKRRAYILNHFLEGFRTTVFRQTLFAEFENKAHKMYWDGEALTAESINNLYRELNEQYYKGTIINDLQEVEWSRIPHFYRYFYVYQYATGFCSAVTIAKGIIETGDASNYLEFLTTGGSDYPINELKVAGIDLADPETVKKALAVFADTVDEFTTIMEEFI